MKLLILLISFATAILLNSCCGDCQDKNRYYQSVITSNVFKDSNGSLYFMYDIENIYKNKNNQWNKLLEQNSTYVPKFLLHNATIKDSSIDINNTTKLLFNNQNVFLKENNKTIFEDTLPLNDEIINNLNIEIKNGYKVEIMPFLTMQYAWDKKKYIISIATDPIQDEHSRATHYKYKVYYAYLYKNFDVWNYQLIDDVHSYIYKSEHINTMTDSIIPRHSLGGKANLCFSHYYLGDDSDGNGKFKQRCFVLENDTVKLKDLFGEIYLKDYKSMLDSTYKDNINSAYNYTFDEKGNMHLFYNKKEDIKNGNYEYFWYGYFEKENPNTPLYEQKIPWQ